MNKYPILIFSVLVLLISGCSSSKSELYTDSSSIENTYGFGLLNKIKGIWAGPVTSTTALGSYSKWIVDFRPISNNQVAAKNELDKQNDIFMSFFIAKYDNQYKVVFRNGGTFNGMQRVSYLIADSISETNTKSYYRFSEILKGKRRAYSEVYFRNDSIYIKSYTNQYNSLTSPSLHMSWKAKIQDASSCQNAVNLFGYPSKTMTKDFSTTFNNITESMYFSTSGIPAGDPYPESAQPYLGKLTANIHYDSGFTADPTKKIFLVLSTQSLINNGLNSFTNMNTISRTVLLSATDTSYTFNYLHPGSYYLYAFYDNDANNVFNTGDWFTLASNSNFLTINSLEQKSVDRYFNTVIP